jgi:hypothetical protein
VVFDPEFPLVRVFIAKKSPKGKNYQKKNGLSIQGNGSGCIVRDFLIIKLRKGMRYAGQ